MTTSMQQWPALVITEGQHAGQSFTISGGEVVLGREADATIVLDSSSVSRHHARLRRLAHVGRSSGPQRDVRRQVGECLLTDSL